MHHFYLTRAAFRVLLVAFLFPALLNAQEPGSLDSVKDMLAEHEWATEAHRDLRLARQRGEILHEEVRRLEAEARKIDAVLPETPEWETWIEGVRKTGTDCGVGVVAHKHEAIAHDTYGELRFPVDARGSAEAIDCFRRRIKNKARISSWQEKERRGDTARAEISIFHVSPPAAPRSCRSFDPVVIEKALRQLKESERVEASSKFAELQEICRDLEAGAELRLLDVRRRFLMDRLGLAWDLQARYGGD